MSKSKVLLQIFPLVTDIDCLERTLVLLKQNSAYLDKEKFHIILDVTLPISDYLTDWNNSILKQDFFINKFNNLIKPSLTFLAKCLIYHANCCPILNPFNGAFQYLI